MMGKNEYLKARNALLTSIDDIDKILDKLKSAGRWAMADMFMDSALIGFLKRDKISNINYDLKRLKSNLENTQNELLDINIDLSDELADKMYDFFVDVVFDNIFTDYRVKKELKEMTDKLILLREHLENMLNEVNCNLNKI